MKRLNLYLMQTITAMALGVVVAPVAFTVGPVINASVYDGQPAQFAVPPSINRSTVKTRFFMFSGSIHNVSQIRVYIDNVYSQTIPIDSGAVDYSFTIDIPQGTHDIKLSAIDAFTGATIEKTVTITYDPNAEASGGVVDQTLQATKQTAVDSSAYLQSQVEQASSTKPAVSLSNAAYTVMSALDLIPTTGQESVQKSLSRFSAISLGVALIIMTSPVITLYHLVRYQLMQWHVHALPALVRHHASFALRAGGLLLVAVGFLI
jgi:hypothetical protein